MKHIEASLNVLFAVMIIICVLPENTMCVDVSSTVPSDVTCGNHTCYGLYTANCSNADAGEEKCTCKVGFKGETCLYDEDECSRGHPCRNRGDCLNTIGSFACNCLQGWSGAHCEDETGDPLICMPGWTLPRCTTDIDECKNTSLFNCDTNQRCKNIPGNYTCTCENGWEGSDCMQDVNECLSNPCQNSGTCNNTQGSFRCFCPAEWTGTHCEHDVNECGAVLVCKNAANCTNINGIYECTCRPEWTGQNCSVKNLCYSNPCMNKGTCQNEQTGINCSCAAGWTGETCAVDVNECQKQSPCMHNGSCTNTEGSYSCNCSIGWEGYNCENNIDECSQTASLCMHGSACTDVDGSYICNCKSGLEGRNCEADIDECQSVPCLNNGTCNNTIGSFDCACAQNYTGTNCEQDRSANSHAFSGNSGNGAGNTSVIVGTVLGSAGAVGAAAAGVFLFKKFRPWRCNKTHSEFSSDGLNRDQKAEETPTMPGQTKFHVT